MYSIALITKRWYLILGGSFGRNICMQRQNRAAGKFSLPKCGIFGILRLAKSQEQLGNIRILEVGMPIIQIPYSIKKPVSHIL